jgi:hypothetical protein
MNKSNQVSIFAVNSSPYQVSYTEWTIRWWKWLLGIPKTQNPALDRTGKLAYGYQNDSNVFFLCQTFGMHDTMPIRHITIPSGTAIFMPVINWISVAPEDGINNDDLLKSAKYKVDAIETLDLFVNSSRIYIDPELDRVTSGTFEVFLPKNNVLDVQEGYKTCLSDGYWIFFIPVQHQVKLSSYGSCSSGINKIGVTYVINFH